MQESGEYTKFGLLEQEVTAHVEGAHQGPVNGIQTFPQEPMFVTSSVDNSLKVRGLILCVIFMKLRLVIHAMWNSRFGYSTCLMEVFDCTTVEKGTANPPVV